jgi:hypothetical protein
MKHATILIAVVLAGGLAACQTAQADPDDTCRARQLDIFLNGLSATEVKVNIANRVGNRPIRYYTEGDPLTMDHNPQRLNVELGKDSRIKRFWCG